MPLGPFSQLIGSPQLKGSVAPFEFRPGLHCVFTVTVCCFLASVFDFGFYVSVLIGWSRQMVVHCPVPFSVGGSPGSDV